MKKLCLLLAFFACAWSSQAGIYLNGQEYDAIHVGGQEFDTLQAGGEEYHSADTLLPGVARQVGTAVAFGLSSPNPGGLTSHGGVLYMAAWASGGLNAGLHTVNATTGVATRIGTANNFGVTPIEDVPGGLASHNNVLYMVGDRTNALYTVNTTTGVATRVGSSSNFGISESAPRGMVSHGGTLYLAGASRGLSTLNTTTGVATRLRGFSGVGSIHGLASHNSTVYLLADTQEALFTLTIATGVATQVGTATRFGVGERDPRGLTSHGGKLLMVGNTLDALLELGT